MFHHNFLVNSFIEPFLCFFVLMKINSRENSNSSVFVSLIIHQKLEKKVMRLSYGKIFPHCPLLCHRTVEK